MGTTLENEYEATDLQHIQAFGSQHRQEDLHLDFKTVKDGVSLGRDDRKNLAICVSGFANSDGGIVVWGVEAKQDRKTKIDCVRSLKPIRNLSACLSEFNTLIGQAADPILENTRNKSIVLDDDKGFIITLVPRGDHQPYEAKLGEDRCYKRSGSSFYRLERYELEQMFARPRAPKLELFTDIVCGSMISGPGGPSYRVSIFIGIENRGNGIARFPRLEFDRCPTFRDSSYGLDGNHHTGLPRVVPRNFGVNRRAFQGGANDVVLGGGRLEVTKLEADYSDSVDSVEGARISYLVQADGVRKVQGERVIEAAEIIRVIRANQPAAFPKIP